MDERRALYTAVSKLFIAQEQAKEDVIGIFLTGSFVHGTLDQYSDLDVFIVLDPSCNYRVRGNTWIKGIEVEYFKNPPQQIRSYFKQEGDRPHTAHMLAHGEAIYTASPVIDALQQEASAIVNTQPALMKSNERVFAQYFLDDFYKDFKDVLIKENSAAITLIRVKIINKCIDLFCKVRRIRRYKDKGLIRQLHEVDSDFARIIEHALSDNWSQLKAMDALQGKMAKLLGGQRAKEWMLKSDLQL